MSSIPFSFDNTPFFSSDSSPEEKEETKKLLNVFEKADEHFLKDYLNDMSLEEFELLLKQVYQRLKSPVARRAITNKRVQLSAGTRPHTTVANPLDKQRFKKKGEDLSTHLFLDVIRKKELKFNAELGNQLSKLKPELYPLLFVELKSKGCLLAFKKFLEDKGLDPLYSALTTFLEKQASIKESPIDLTFFSHLHQSIRNAETKGASVEKVASKKGSLPVLKGYSVFQSLVLYLFSLPSKAENPLRNFRFQAKALASETFKREQKVYRRAEANLIKSQVLARKEESRDISDIVKRGEGYIQDRLKKYSFASRLGLSVSSPVVTHSGDNKRFVCDALVADEEDTSVIELLRNYFKSHDKESLGKLNFFRDGGDAYSVTALEREALEEVIHYSENKGFHEFSDKERLSIKQYRDNLLRSKDLSAALCAFMSSTDLYLEKKGDSEEIVKNKKEHFQSDYTRFCKELVYRCASLNEGESLYLDNNIHDHSMRLSIRKEKGAFVICNYDSSGTMERTDLSSGPLGFSQLMYYDLLFGSKDKMGLKSNAREFRIPESRLYLKGEAYFNKLLYPGTCRGLKEKKEEIQEVKKNLSNNMRSQFYRFLLKVGMGIDVPNPEIYLARRRLVYKDYLDTFDSLALYKSPPSYKPLKQSTQITRDCFAKRTESNQVFEMGFQTQKKFKKAFLNQQREFLLKELLGTEGSKDIEPVLKEVHHQLAFKERHQSIYSSQELKKIASELASFKDVPTIDNLVKELKHVWDEKKILENELKGLLSDEQLRQERQEVLDRLDAYLQGLATDFYENIQKNRPEELSQYFSSGADSFKFEDKKALEALAEYQTEKRWLNIFAILDNAHERQAVKRRFLDDFGDRYTSISLSKLKKAYQHKAGEGTGALDVEKLKNAIKEAQLVSFMSFFGRRKRTKVEVMVEGKFKELRIRDYLSLIRQYPDVLLDSETMKRVEFLRSENKKVKTRIEREFFPLFKNEVVSSLNDITQPFASAPHPHIIATQKLKTIWEKKKEAIDTKLERLKKDRDKHKGKNTYELKLKNNEYNYLRRLRQSIELTTTTAFRLANNTLETQAKEIEEIRKSFEKRYEEANITSLLGASQWYEREVKRLQRLEQKFQKSFQEIYLRLEEQERNIYTYKADLRNKHLIAFQNASPLDAFWLSMVEKDSRKKKLPLPKESLQRKIQEFNQQIVNYRHEFLDMKWSQSQEEKLYKALGKDKDFFIETAEHYPQQNELEKVDAEQKEEKKNLQKIWVVGMARLYLEHENPERLKSFPESFNHFFVNWLEVRCGQSLEELQKLGFVLHFTEEQVQNLMGEAFESRVDQELINRKKAGETLREFYKHKVKKEAVASRVEVSTPIFTSDNLKPQQALESLPIFSGPKNPFERELSNVKSSSAFQFQKDYPFPRLKNFSDVELYYEKAIEYLSVLKAYEAVEAKGPMLLEGCYQVLQDCLSLESVPIKLLDLISELQERVLVAEMPFDEYVKKISNEERSFYLQIKLACDLLSLKGKGVKDIDRRLYSYMWQVMESIYPSHGPLKALLQSFRPVEGHDQQKLIEYRGLLHALRQSPLALEGVYEGAAGIHDALLKSPFDKIGGIPKRDLYERLVARGLKHTQLNWLLDSSAFKSSPDFFQFIKHPDSRDFMQRFLENLWDKLQGKELARVQEFLKKHEKQATEEEDKNWLILMRLTLTSRKEPHLFDDADYQFYINSLEEKVNSLKQGELLLQGHARLMKAFSLGIERKQKQGKAIDKELAAFCCSRLAYQRLWEQASPELKESFLENKSYFHTLRQVELIGSKLQPQITLKHREAAFLKSLDTELRRFIKNKWIDGEPIELKKLNEAPYPGFVELAPRTLWDILHGHVYKDENLQSSLPKHLEEHPYLLQLGLHTLNYVKKEGKYVYGNGGRAQVILKEKEDGQLLIQRRFNLEGRSQLLQYLPQRELAFLPHCFIQSFALHQAYQDEKGNIYAFDENNVLCLKLEKFGDKEKSWKLHSLTGGEESYELLEDEEHDFKDFCSAAEVLKISGSSSYYLPSIDLKVTKEGEILEGPHSGKIIESISPGSLLLSHSLTEDEKKSYQLKKRELLEKLADIGSDSLRARDEKRNIQNSLQELENQFSAKLSKSLIHLSEHRAYVELRDKRAALRQAVEKKESEESRLSLEREIQLIKAQGPIYSSIPYLSGHFQLQNPLQFFCFDISASPQEAIKALHKLRSFQVFDEHSAEKLEKSLANDGNSPLLLVYLCLLSIEDEIKKRRLVLNSSEKEVKEGMEPLKEALLSAIAKLSEDDKATIKRLRPFKELWVAVAGELELLSLKSLFIEDMLPTEGHVFSSVSLDYEDRPFPVEALGQSLSYTPKALEIEDSQKRLQQKVFQRFEGQALEEVQQQHNGFMFENYGIFSKESFYEILKLSTGGLAAFKKEEADVLFDSLLSLGAFEAQEASQYRIGATLRESFYPHHLATDIKNMGYTGLEAQQVIEAIENFFQQAIHNGGEYRFKTLERRQDFEKRLKSKIEGHRQSFLEAEERLLSMLSPLKKGIEEAKEAFLFDDYSPLISHLSDGKRSSASTALKNATLRYLYQATEVQHLEDIQKAVKNKQLSKAMSLLTTKRNYPLKNLLEEKDGITEKQRHEEKILRALLLFEEDFGHRCLIRQVEVFKGLLKEDIDDPEKIEAAQARMGFGKTSLLPLIALLRADKRSLVRFIVPPSALETNTHDLSHSLERMLQKKAIKDSFRRYQLPDDSPNEKGVSKRLIALRYIEKDLKARLEHYRNIQQMGFVLTQAPQVRNALENQLKLFLHDFNGLKDEEQKKVMLSCIDLLATINSMKAVNIFDELDATQDPLSTEVNFTLGSPKPIDSSTLIPLAGIIKVFEKTADKEKALKELIIKYDPSLTVEKQKQLYKYTTDNQCPYPFDGVPPDYLLLLRGIFADEGIFSILTDKEPSRDYGVWFSLNSEGEKEYDTQSRGEPFLVAIPYQAANEPKPMGSRFDNPEVSALATLRYYQDSKTPILEDPHLNFMLQAVKEGDYELYFKDEKNHLFPFYHELVEVANIPDPMERKERSAHLFKRLQDSEEAFRRSLALCIIAKQVSIDEAKVNSNRYQRGRLDEEWLGFSGTSGDTSPFFQRVKKDPAADGQISFGIMGRSNNQEVVRTILPTGSVSGDEYSRLLIEDFAGSFKASTRVLIDVGGLIKSSNEEVARQLLKTTSKFKGVLFYDDCSNTKCVLQYDSHGAIIKIPLSYAIEKELEKGEYFTYFDQAHSRGANIPQMDGAHAFLTFSKGVSNSDYKQAIMRMRKMIDPSLCQSFSLFMPFEVHREIASELELSDLNSLKGSDVATYLLDQELVKNQVNPALLLKQEVQSLLKHLLLELSAAVSKSYLEKEPLTDKELSDYQQQLEKLQRAVGMAFIDKNPYTLQDRYGQLLKEQDREGFLNQLKGDFDEALRLAREATSEEIHWKVEWDGKYQKLRDQIIEKRKKQLPERILLPHAQHLSTSHVEVQAMNLSEAQSESTSQSTSQTHSFSEVQHERVPDSFELGIPEDRIYAPIDLSFLNDPFKKERQISTLSRMRPLFTPEDPVWLGPKFLEKKEGLPPIRYVLMKENKKYICLDEDEADLFALRPVKGYQLLDLQSKTKEQWSQQKNHSPAFKKLLMASHRLKLPSIESISTLEETFEGVCDSFHPKKLLENTQGDLESRFKLQKWGYGGLTSCGFDMHLEKKKIGKRPLSQFLTLQLGKEARPVKLKACLHPRIQVHANSEKGCIEASRSSLENDLEENAEAIASAVNEINRLKSLKQYNIHQIKQRINDLEISFEKAKKEGVKLKTEGGELTTGLQETLALSYRKRLCALIRGIGVEAPEAFKIDKYKDRAKYFQRMEMDLEKKFEELKASCPQSISDEQGLMNYLSNAMQEEAQRHAQVSIMERSIEEALVEMALKPGIYNGTKRGKGKKEQVKIPDSRSQSAFGEAYQLPLFEGSETKQGVFESIFMVMKVAGLDEKECEVLKSCLEKTFNHEEVKKQDKHLKYYITSAIIPVLKNEIDQHFKGYYKKEAELKWRGFDNDKKAGIIKNLLMKKGLDEGKLSEDEALALFIENRTNNKIREIKEHLQNRFIDSSFASQYSEYASERVKHFVYEKLKVIQAEKLHNLEKQYPLLFSDYSDYIFLDLTLFSKETAVAIKNLREQYQHHHKQYIQRFQLDEYSEAHLCYQKSWKSTLPGSKKNSFVAMESIEGDFFNAVRTLSLDFEEMMKLRKKEIKGLKKELERSHQVINDQRKKLVELKKKQEALQRERRAMQTLLTDEEELVQRLDELQVYTEEKKLEALFDIPALIDDYHATETQLLHAGHIDFVPPLFYDVYDNSHETARDLLALQEESEQDYEKAQTYTRSKAKEVRER